MYLRINREGKKTNQSFVGCKRRLKWIFDLAGGNNHANVYLFLDFLLELTENKRFERRETHTQRRSSRLEAHAFEEDFRLIAGVVVHLFGRFGHVHDWLMFIGIGHDFAVVFDENDTIEQKTRRDHTWIRGSRHGDGLTGLHNGQRVAYRSECCRRRFVRFTRGVRRSSLCCGR